MTEPSVISLGRVLKALDTSLHCRLLEQVATGRTGVILASGAGPEVLAYGGAAPYASREAALQEARANGWAVIGDMPPGGTLSTTKVAYALFLLCTRQETYWKRAAERANAFRDNVSDTMREAGLLK